MRVKIFDVGHGHCAVITAPNGRRWIVDIASRADFGGAVGGGG